MTLLMLVLASITVLTLDYHGEVSHGITHVRNGVRDVLAPIQRGIAAALHPIGDAFAGAFHYGALQSENRRLEQQLGSLQAAQAERAFAARQAQSVLALAGLPFVANISTTPAEVISAPTSNFQYLLEIDKGTGSGVGPRMPVVSGRGLVGTVTGASGSTATVRLVTDKSSSIGVTFGTGRRSGSAIAGGQGYGEPLLVQQFSGPLPSVGETVFSSGTDGGAYPAGIPIARVTSVKVAAGGLTTTVAAEPLVDLGTIQYVSVLEWLPQP
ncbi:MAG: rod shape-determining protein MreC [Actinomycetota bacterium]|nr:rod shape-determining protein MreC [Actinomycetota bacterium]